MSALAVAEVMPRPIMTLVPPRRKAPAKPFTLPHFRAWASDLILDTGESWHPERFQEQFFADVFAGYPEIWWIVPEGNTKTTTLAGLALYHAEFRPHANVPVAASSREQAEILYRQAEGFVLRSDRLYAPMYSEIAKAKGKRKLEVPRFTCLEGYRRIIHVGGGRIQVFAADDRTGDGVIPTLGLLDELHRHRDLDLYRTWAGKLNKRGGQVVAISTAGEPGSDFEQTRDAIREHAGSVTRRGSYTRSASPALVLQEWALPETAEPDDFYAVKRTNPFSGITVPMLREKYDSPTMSLQHWLRFVCNRSTRTREAAISEGEWDAAKTTEQIPDGQPIWLGLDVAWKWDTTAAVPLWWRDHDYRLLGPATILTPPRNGSSLDPHEVEEALRGIHARNPVHTVVMDTSRAEQLASWIAETLGATVIDRQQTNPLAVQDFDRLMEALRSGWLHHTGDPALTAHALNAIAKMLPMGDLRFERPVSGRTAEQERRVIDALIAAAMVHSQACQPAQEPATVPNVFVF